MSEESIPLILFCPQCHKRHIDPEDMRSHKTHACQGCGFLWAPSTIPTVGVGFLPNCQNETPTERDAEAILNKTLELAEMQPAGSRGKTLDFIQREFTRRWNQQ